MILVWDTYFSNFQAGCFILPSLFGEKRLLLQIGFCNSYMLHCHAKLRGFSLEDLYATRI